jgi:hypothetical protein
MTYRGHVSNGVVVLDEPTALPDGTMVTVEPLEAAVAQSDAEDNGRTLYESLKPFIGKLEGLPADASVNLDHYLYGVPKRE